VRLFRNYVCEPPRRAIRVLLGFPAPPKRTRRPGMRRDKPQGIRFDAVRLLDGLRDSADHLPTTDEITRGPWA
jgi:hypothetical protein